MKKTLLSLFILCLAWQASATGLIDSVKAITDTSVGQYQKFEVGLMLDSIATPLPPARYNYNDIWAYAVFKGPNGEVDTVDGFWYQPFSRCDTCYAPTNIC